MIGILPIGMFLCSIRCVLEIKQIKQVLSLLGKKHTSEVQRIDSKPMEIKQSKGS